MTATVEHLTISVEGAMRSFMGSIEDRCPPGQMWREFTQNAIEAYTRHDLTGDVVWYHEPELDDGQPTGRYHWGVFDTGIGMSRETMRAYLGRVFSSGGEIAADRNHGIGSRQAGLRDCPEGIEWISLYDGAVSSAVLSQGEPGRPPRIEYDDYALEDVHPAIREAGRGTQVIFWGLGALAPMTLYRQALWTRLSQRYHVLPPGIELRVQAWVKDEGKLRSTFHRVSPQAEALADCAQLSETFVFRDGSHAEITILKTEHLQTAQGERYRKEHGLKSRHKLADLKARCAVVYQEEAYESVAGGGAQKRIQRFGITYGSDRVVLCLFPNPELYIPSEERSRIVPRAITGEEGPSLPIDGWAREFVEGMPSAIREYVERSAIGTQAEGLRELYDRARRVWDTPGPSSAPGDGQARGAGLADPARPPAKPSDKPPKKKRRPRSEDAEPQTPRPQEQGSGGERGSPREAMALPRIVWVRNAELPEGDPCRDAAGCYNHNALGGSVLKLNDDWAELRAWRRAVAAARASWGQPRARQATRDVYQVLAVDLLLRHRHEGKAPPEPEEIGECFEQRMSRDLLLDALNPRG